MAPLNLYDTTIPPIQHTLTALSTILTKASSTAESKSLTLDQLPTLRLIPDMLPFTFQITSACNAAKSAAVRLGGHAEQTFDDNLTTFPELQARVTETIELLKSVKREGFEGKEKEIIEFRGIEFTGLAYATKFVLPNFYFHVVTAYDLLRMKGIEVGKLDFLGPIKDGGRVE